MKSRETKQIVERNLDLLCRFLQISVPATLWDKLASYADTIADFGNPDAKGDALFPVLLEAILKQKTIDNAVFKLLLEQLRQHDAQIREPLLTFFESTTIEPNRVPIFANTILAALDNMERFNVLWPRLSMLLVDVDPEKLAPILIERLARPSDVSYVVLQQLLKTRAEHYLPHLYRCSQALDQPKLARERATQCIQNHLALDLHYSDKKVSHLIADYLDASLKEPPPKVRKQPPKKENHDAIPEVLTATELDDKALKKYAKTYTEAQIIEWMKAPQEEVRHNALQCAIHKKLNSPTFQQALALQLRISSSALREDVLDAIAAHPDKDNRWKVDALIGSFEHSNSLQHKNRMVKMLISYGKTTMSYLWELLENDTHQQKRLLETLLKTELYDNIYNHFIAQFDASTKPELLEICLRIMLRERNRPFDTRDRKRLLKIATSQYFYADSINQRLALRILGRDSFDSTLEKTLEEIYTKSRNRNIKNEINRIFVHNGIDLEEEDLDEDD